MKLRVDTQVRICRSFAVVLLTGAVLAGCSSSSDLSDPMQQSAAIDAVNLALDNKQCADALIQIKPYYNSGYSNNLIRIATAATYGCFATVDFFKLISDLTSFGGNLGGSGFWEFLVEEFPSSATPVDDKIPQSAENGIDALLSAIVPGIVLLPSSLVSTDPNNIQSLSVGDRIDDANVYLAFVSMALMGSLQNRNGLPTSNFHKSVPLPWTAATQMQGDGCSFVSGLLNFFDSLDFIVKNASTSVAKAFTTIQTTLEAGLDTACALGCTTCGGSVSCSGCPLSLRNRASCTGLSTDINSCAAAAVVEFVNASWSGPP